MKAKFIGMPVLLLCAAVAGYWGWTRNDNGSGALTLYGNVDVREVELAFRQPGRLSADYVLEGAAVKAGDVLAELDAKPFEDALKAAQANVQRAKAELLKLRRGNRAQDIDRAREAVRQAEAAFGRADADLTRQVQLARTGAASQKGLEAARSSRDELAAQLAAARQALSLQIEGARAEDIAAARAQLAAAEAAFAEAQTALGDTKLIAPADATVLSRLREPGSMVSSRDAVYTLSLGDPVYIRAYVSEPHLAEVNPGTTVTIRTDSSKKIYRGHVGFVSPRAEFTPKSVETPELRTDLVYRLRIVVDKDAQGLLQAMPVSVLVAAPGGGKS